MTGNMNTDLGKVQIGSKVIGKMAGYTALDCFGIVGMAGLSRKDGIVRLLTRDHLSKGIRTEITDEGIIFDFHVIMAYGVAIPAACDTLINSVRYQIENSTGFKVKKINIFVEGIRVID